MNILVIGDIVGDSGINAAINHVARLKKEYNADFCIINGENACSGNGINPQVAKTLFDCGANVITLGNHAFKNKDIFPYLDENPNIIRPINFPKDSPGAGFREDYVAGKKIAVISALGKIYMDSCDCPFALIDDALKKTDADIVIVDFHAEVTSEKQALSWYLDGRVSVVFGTHTHVQTADARILPNGTGYITDIGMTGPYNSCLGVKKEIIIDRLKNNILKKFEFANGPAQLCGAVFEIGDDNFCKKIHTVNIRP